MRRGIGIASEGEFLAVLTQSMGKTKSPTANISCAVQVIPESRQNSVIRRADISRARQHRTVRFSTNGETRGTLRSDNQAAIWSSVIYAAAFE